jgi:hypothetical protein
LAKRDGSTHDPAANHRRPIHHRNQRTCNESDALQRLLLNIELPIEPLESDIDTTDGFEDETGT